MRKPYVDAGHEYLRDTIAQKLAFDPSVPYEEWRAAIREKFITLTGLDKIEANGCELNYTEEETVHMDGYTRIRFLIDTENCVPLPCHLLIPDVKKDTYPLAITLQGHASGAYHSMGIIKKDGDAEYQKRGAFALQAVKRGYIALVIEQRGMGEQISAKTSSMCKHVVTTAFLLGRTLIGERVWDVKRALDAVLERYDNIDRDRIVITGNSGGGTTSFYVACYDERITMSAPSCAFCPYKESILSIYHCECNFIPGAYEWFEMQDLAALIAPRKLHIISGEKDTIFPIDGVKRGYETVQKIYAAAGVPENCQLAITPREHWWCEDIVWNAIGYED